MEDQAIKNTVRELYGAGTETASKKTTTLLSWLQQEIANTFLSLWNLVTQTSSYLEQSSSLAILWAFVKTLILTFLIYKAIDFLTYYVVNPQSFFNGTTFKIIATLLIIFAASAFMAYVSAPSISSIDIDQTIQNQEILIQNTTSQLTNATQENLVIQLA